MEHLKRVHPDDGMLAIVEVEKSTPDKAARGFADEDSDMEDGARSDLEATDSEAGKTSQKAMLEAKLRELENQRSKVDSEIEWVHG